MTFGFTTKMRVVDSFFSLPEPLLLFSSALLVGPGTKVKHMARISWDVSNLCDTKNDKQSAVTCISGDETYEY